MTRLKLLIKVEMPLRYTGLGKSGGHVALNVCHEHLLQPFLLPSLLNFIFCHLHETSDPLFL